MPFRHPDRSHDLGTRIEMEVRERIEEAIDYVCLDALVRSRRTRGLPPPQAASPDDRRAYTQHVLALLERLGGGITPRLSDEEQRKVAAAAEGPGDAQARLLATQVALARLLPDYWQRFEAISTGYLSDSLSDRLPDPDDGRPERGDGASGSESRGLLSRLFGRG
jgi:hypothetical protein